MADFKVPVIAINAIEEHPNADRLELAVIGDYRSIVLKGQFKPGDVVVYIPEASVVPENILDELNLTGKLSGKQKNRVKAVRLRGIVSQGICYAHADFTEPQDDVSEVLGITKYEPEISTHMSGEVANLFGHILKYDIENIKRYPNIFEELEHVVATEKIHGTFCQLGFIPGLNHDEMLDKDFIVASKGLGGQGLAFKDNDRNSDNLYVRTVKGKNMHMILKKWG